MTDVELTRHPPDRKTRKIFLLFLEGSLKNTWGKFDRHKQTIPKIGRRDHDSHSLRKKVNAPQHPIQILAIQNVLKKIPKPNYKYLILLVALLLSLRM
ncbi:hypothetical protein AZI86_14315 [Bdellovibrio bacteriovorus]|uniref:Uncharacterized protein n=1 Tax=Bdellovibrio bacteriovorus TaxID=959 RepID=A0A150WJV9_BDEBC|nr:hypothetical protein AZI86_14315 [Bdellovibrio bacteriovorus]